MGKHRKPRKSKSRAAAAAGASALVVTVPVVTGSQPAVNTDNFPRISNTDTMPKIAVEKSPINTFTVDDRNQLKVALAGVRKRIANEARHRQAERDRHRAPATNPQPVLRERARPAPRPAKTVVSSNLHGVAKAIAFAYEQLGKPYVWGGVGPSAFDCSGLVMAAWAYAGVTIPRTSQAQWAGLRHVSTSDMQPGDLLVFYSDASHVGLYVGGGYMIEASEPSQPIKKVAIAGYYMDNLLGVVRP